jgi:hypothetical protein
MSILTSLSCVCVSDKWVLTVVLLINYLTMIGKKQVLTTFKLVSGVSHDCLLNLKALLFKVATTLS